MGKITFVGNSHENHGGATEFPLPIQSATDQQMCSGSGLAGGFFIHIGAAEQQPNDDALTQSVNTPITRRRS